MMVKLDADRVMEVSNLQLKVKKSKKLVIKHIAYLWQIMCILVFELAAHMDGRLTIGTYRRNPTQHRPHLYFALRG